MAGVMDVIRAIRNLRAEMNVSVGRRARLILKPHEGWADALSAAESYFKRLAFASSVEILSADAENPAKSASAMTPACNLYIPLGDLVDIDKEIARLTKDKARVEGEIARAQGKLNNPGFVSKAPAQLIEAEKEKLEKNSKVIESLTARIAELESMK